jgi:ribosomal protein S18 acetylase RimI-like enzyme
MTTWVVQRLAKSHDRSLFDSGVPILDEWLKKIAGQHEKRDLARTYVATAPNDVRVAGYYAIANHRVDHESLTPDLAKGMPRIDVPVVLLGRLAVDRSVQGQGLGETLLLDALRRTSHISEQIGVCAVEVDAINDAAKRFYMKFGFVPLLDDERHLFLSMKKVRNLQLPPF